MCEIWTNKSIDDEATDVYEYILNLRGRLEETAKIATKALEDAKECQKNYYVKKAKQRSLNKGDGVLLLLPTDDNKLSTKWKEHSHLQRGLVIARMQ